MSVREATSRATRFLIAFFTGAVVLRASELAASSPKVGDKPALDVRQNGASNAS